MIASIKAPRPLEGMGWPRHISSVTRENCFCSSKPHARCRHAESGFCSVTLGHDRSGASMRPELVDSAISKQLILDSQPLEMYRG